MNDLTIEKGVPVPESVLGRAAMYPFAQMKVGDSFFVGEADLPGIGLDKINARLRAASTNFRRDNPTYKFRVLKVTETRDGVETQGTRCWRMA